MKYRVKEIYNDEFIIELKVIKKTGFLWWKKEKEVWRRCNKFGHEGSNSNINPYLPAFKTLKEAKEQINRFQTKPIYHNC